MNYRCEYCDAAPDQATEEGITFSLAHPVFGEFRDCSPARWLLFYGGGPYGRWKLSCPEHRGDLVVYLRQHLGTVGWHVWTMGPYQSAWETRGTPRTTPRTPRYRGGWG